MLKQIGLAAALAAFAVPVAAVTAIDTPDAAYLAQTVVLDVAGPDWSTHVFVADSQLQVDFSSLLEARTVPDSWNTWGSPPEVEDGTPRVWYTIDLTSVTFTFDNALSIWGFEVEGNDFSANDFTLEFLQDGAVIHSITRTIDGNAGARLMAGEAGAGEYFTSVRLSGTDNFSVAQLRYQLATVSDTVPEPASWALLIAGFGLVGVSLRRRVARQYPTLTD